MDFAHKPVMFEECMEGLAIKPEGIYVDGTLGGGGHAGGICERLTSAGLFIGIDRDEAAIKAATEQLEKYSCKKVFANANYSRIKAILDKEEIDAIDGAILDLGVSSFQLDEASRGFSYMNDGPLDMRMDKREAFTAAELVNRYDERALADVIRRYGEERFAARIAAAIVRRRAEKPFERTGELCEVIKSAIPAATRREGPHPAKRTFQALRIEVNGELALLGKAVSDFIDVLKPGGRLCVISFHSLEDRIVKNAYLERERPCNCPKGYPCVCGNKADGQRVTRKPIVPKEDETEENPRARSAKLRILEKV